MREEQLHVRRQLLKQAILIQLDVEDAVREIHGRKVDYRKTGTGFELSCLVGNKAETLTVGSSE